MTHPTSFTTHAKSMCLCLQVPFFIFFLRWHNFCRLWPQNLLLPCSCFSAHPSNITLDHMIMCIMFVTAHFFVDHPGATMKSQVGHRGLCQLHSDRASWSFTGQKKANDAVLLLLAASSCLRPYLVFPLGARAVHLLVRGTYSFLPSLLRQRFFKLIKSNLLLLRLFCFFWLHIALFVVNAHFSIPTSSHTSTSPHQTCP